MISVEEMIMIRMNDGGNYEVMVTMLMIKLNW